MGLYKSHGLNALAGLPTFGILGSDPPPSDIPLGSLLGNAVAQIKRKTYFAFKYTDVMRVNNVREAWKIHHPDNALMRSFYDSSLWESKKLESDDALKSLIRDGVKNTSAVCVLVGTETWSSRWVKYEIVRAIIESRGLLAVHLNSLNHHQRRHPDPLGYNPLQLLGIYQAANGSFYIYEWQSVVVNALSGQTAWQWLPYVDYTIPVSLPRYLTSPAIGYVIPLSYATKVYDFYQDNGHQNIGAWIDEAARAVGR